MDQLLGNLIWKITGNTTDFDKALKSSDKKTAQFANVVKNAGNLIQGYLGVKGAKAVIKFGVAAQKAFAEDELAAIKMNAAIKNSSFLSEGAEERFNALAASLQQNAIFGDDAVKSQVAYLASLGKTEEEITRLITVAADYAAATDGDLGGAIQILNGTLQGQARTLGQQNLKIKSLTEEELKAGKAIDIVAQQYKGYAKIVGEAAAGGNAQFSASMGDVQEAIGRLIQSSGWKEVQDFLTVLADKSAGKISTVLDLEEAIKANKKGLATDKQKLLVLENNYKLQEKVIEKAYEQIETTRKGTQSRELAVKKYTEEIDELMEISAQHKAIEKAIKLKESEEKKAADTAKKSADKKAAADAAAIKAAEREAELAQERIDRDAQQRADYLVLVKEIQAIGAAQDDNHAAEEQAAIDRAIALGMSEDETKILTNAIRAQFDELRKKDAIEEFKENMSEAFSYVNDAAFSLGEQLAAGELSWKSFAKIGLEAIASLLKALGSELEIMAVEQFVKFLANKDPAALAASIAASAGGVAAFAGAGVVSGYAGSFEGGGVVGGTAYHGDKMTASVNSGERILTASQNAAMYDMLSEFMKTGNSGTQTINLTLDGKVIASTVTRYQRKGKV